MVYVRWLKMIDKDGKEVTMYSASHRSKLILLGDAPQDLSWAQHAPEKYLEAKSLQML